MRSYIPKFIIIIVIYTAGASYAKTKYSDEYLQGYFDSVFASEFDNVKSLVIVKNGTIILDQDSIDQNTSESPHVILNKTRNIASKFGLREKVFLRSNYSKENSGNISKKYVNNRSLGKESYNTILMPSGGLFKPLIADPKWPRFTLAYQYYFEYKHSKQVFAPNFGASFSLFKLSTKNKYHSIEVGIQAGLFGIMDIARNPTALINADYYIAVPITYSNGNFSTLTRVYHLSSHLGDEFMLTEEGQKIKRINLSYEGIDILGSFELNKFRLYGGGGYIMHKDPSYVKRGKVQLGLEHKFDTTFLDGTLRPVSGIDIKFQELKGWYPDISCKIGVQVENPAKFNNTTVLIMLEYFRGKSVHGQFYDNRAEYVGLGIHAFL